jgi:hypothetical protein
MNFYEHIKRAEAERLAREKDRNMMVAVLVLAAVAMVSGLIWGL